MKTARIAALFFAAASLFLAAPACSILGSDDAATSEQNICTPGANVFCRCVDRTPGTKPCIDGKSFGDCTTGKGKCIGGEAPDEDATPGSGDPDQCPGKTISVLANADTVIDGDTTAARDDAKGGPGACSAGGGSPDHVYRIQPATTGTLNVKVQGLAPLDPMIYLRTSCNDEASEVQCAEATPEGSMEQLNYHVNAGQNYYLVVDGASGSAGKYQVTMKLGTTAFCGNGQVDASEACDDGNQVDNDGCSSDCTKVSGDPTSGNGCPGHPVDVWPGKTVLGTSSTTAYGNAFTKTGTSCLVSSSNLNAAQDHVYAVTAHATGVLKIVASPQDSAFNLMLIGRSTCTDPTTQGPGMCSNDYSDGVPETLLLSVTNGQTVSVAVDAVLNHKGSYTISFEYQ